MTLITFASKNYTVKVTDNTNEMAEVLGFNISGLRFVADTVETNQTKKIRGYIMRPFFGNVEMMYGPVTLNREDLA